MAGPSKSGKTKLLKKILTSNSNLIEPQINRIVYCYSRWQDSFNNLTQIVPQVEFKHGLPDIEEFDHLKNNLLVLDDLMREGGKDSSIYDIFTVDSRRLTCPQYLIEGYKDAVESQDFGYLYLDFTQTTQKSMRVLTGICPDEQRIIYQIKS